MQHLFSSGEIINLKNVKELTQGRFVSDYIEYDEITASKEFEAVGKIHEKAVSVRFKLRSESFEDISFKSMIKILMQSDILQADWEEYNVQYL